MSALFLRSIAVTFVMLHSVVGTAEILLLDRSREKVDGAQNNSGRSVRRFPLPSTKNPPIAGYVSSDDAPSTVRGESSDAAVA